MTQGSRSQGGREWGPSHPIARPRCGRFKRTTLHSLFCAMYFFLSFFLHPPTPPSPRYLAKMGRGVRGGSVLHVLADLHNVAEPPHSLPESGLHASESLHTSHRPPPKFAYCWRIIQELAGRKESGLPVLYLQGRQWPKKELLFKKG